MVVDPQSWPRLKSKIKINSVKDTKGAQVGAVMAMVKDSLIPTTRPAKSGAHAEAKRPIMTTANTTPIQAKICEGAKVKVNATQTPAHAAKPPHTPASPNDNWRALIPKAWAMWGWG
jgi:hypothetical protein